MIFVTVGTNEAPFDRLLQAVCDLGLNESLVVQHGSSRCRPDRAMCIESLPLGELKELVRQARVTVTHAGVGTILTALAVGKRPVVVPRLHAFGEAVDDHQVEFARRLGPELITLVEDIRDLRDALELPTERDSLEIAADPRLIEDLRVMLADRIAGAIGPIRVQTPL